MPAPGLDASVCVVAAILQACFLRLPASETSSTATCQPVAYLQALHAVLSHHAASASTLDSMPNCHQLHSALPTCTESQLGAAHHCDTFVCRRRASHGMACSSLDGTRPALVVCNKQEAKRWLAFIAQHHPNVHPPRGLLKQVSLLFTECPWLMPCFCGEACCSG